MTATQTTHQPITAEERRADMATLVRAARIAEKWSHYVTPGTRPKNIAVELRRFVDVVGTD